MRLHGILTSLGAELNGQEGVVYGFVPGTQRYKVRVSLESTGLVSKKAVLKENMEILGAGGTWKFQRTNSGGAAAAGEVVASAANAGNANDAGEVSKTAYVFGSSPRSALAQSQSKEAKESSSPKKKKSPEKVPAAKRIPDGTRVRLEGILTESASGLNGQEAEIYGFVAETQRYKVRLAGRDDGTGKKPTDIKKAVLRENFVLVEDEKKTTTKEAKAAADSTASRKSRQSRKSRKSRGVVSPDGDAESYSGSSGSYSESSYSGSDGKRGSLQDTRSKFLEG